MPSLAELNRSYRAVRKEITQVSARMELGDPVLMGLMDLEQQRDRLESLIRSTARSQGRQIFGMFQSGEFVYSKARFSPEGWELLLPILPEALLEVWENFEGRVETVVKFRRIIGVTHVVSTTDADEIEYRQIANQTRGISRFVQNRNPEPVSELTVRLNFHNDLFELRSANFGRPTLQEPYGASRMLARTDDPTVLERSREFWRTHAKVPKFGQVFAPLKFTEQQFFSPE